MSLLPVDNGLTDDHKRALQALAHIALGSMSHTIERYAANDLLNYMGELERQRTEARDALTASEKDAARYQWLREQMHIAGAAIVEVLQPAGDWGNSVTAESPEGLDAAIDAAMEKANG